MIGQVEAWCRAGNPAWSAPGISVAVLIASPLRQLRPARPMGGVMSTKDQLVKSTVMRLPRNLSDIPVSRP
jgi:hypothetical protein